MSIQTIINNARFITIDKRKVSGQTISRSGRILTAEVASAVPYRFTVGMHSGLTYSTNRGLLEELDTLDRVEEELVDIGDSSSGIQYVTAYQGDLTSGQISQLRTSSGTAFSGKSLFFNTTGVSGGTGYLFKKGDFVQPGISLYRYPYQVTQDIPFSSSSSLEVPVHRAVIDQSGFTETNVPVRVGVDVRWYVKMIRKPRYTVVPHDRIKFDSDFELVEVIL